MNKKNTISHVNQPNSKVVEHAIQMALTYLENERKQNFNEAAHRMRFPINAGFTCINEVHTGLTFQLTIIIEAFLACRDAGFKIDYSGLEKDFNQIIGLKDKKLNAWKYFPTLPELPPDIDDLAQIMMIFWKYGDNRLNNTFETLNDLILHFVHMDGSINTWIFDHNKPTHNYNLMLTATKNMWGDKPDAEVIANFLYALKKLKSSKYDGTIQKGCRFLAEKRRRQGYWKSTWYCGNYYGTYVCTRLLAVFPEYHTFLKQTVKYLVSNQNKNKSWGKYQASRINDTSFAILSLLELNPYYPVVSEVINNGIKFLISIQYPNGSWQASDFIKMKTDRVSSILKILLKLRKRSVLTYKSSTITTAIALKALCHYFEAVAKKRLIAS